MFTVILIENTSSIVAMVLDEMKKLVQLCCGTGESDCVARVFQIPERRRDMKDSRYFAILCFIVPLDIEKEMGQY